MKSEQEQNRKRKLRKEVNEMIDNSGKTIDAHVHFGKLSKTYGDDYKDVSHQKYPANRYRLDIVKKLLNQISPKRILDIGCGTGDPLIEISRMGYDIHGFDFSEEMIAEAKRNLTDAGLEPELVYQDNMEEPCETRAGTYDCLIALGAVYYARDFDKTMKKLTALLKPGGSFILSLRNELFSLFSMNQYTLDFILEKLIPRSELSSSAQEELQQLVGRRFTEEVAEKVFGNVDSAGVHSMFHNPLTVSTEVLEPVGLSSEGTYFYHYHALPPILEHVIPAEFRALSSQMEDGNDWRGNFMASGFVVHARRA